MTSDRAHGAADTPAAVILVAAGRGERAGGAVPKQYRVVAGRALLAHTAAAFLDHPAVGTVVVVIDPACRDLYDSAVAGLALAEPVAGGRTRQESVLCGLRALAPSAPTCVLIHDAARAAPGAALIGRVLDAITSGGGAIPALPVTDTLKRGGSGLIETTVPREGLFRAQTPQGFDFAAILAAHEAAAGEELTDDAAVAERAGMPVRLVPGDEGNIKVTNPEDFDRIAARIAPPRDDVRVGNGFDVHRFGPGESIMLCGVPVAHSHGLIGHSDADVGLHALTDAILGALGDGDIGQHFPPNDAQWRGASSDRFLAHAAGLVQARGGVIGHADVTLICERPKVGPHRDAMRARIAAILGIDMDRISVKATTTEELGFTGRREGIAAQATAVVRLPSATA